MEELIQLLSNLESNATYYLAKVRDNKAFDYDQMLIILKGSVKIIEDKINFS